MSKAPDQRVLERLIDRYGLGGVLKALAHVCRDKADDLTSAWNDDGGARLWRADACALISVAAQVSTAERLAIKARRG